MIGFNIEICSVCVIVRDLDPKGNDCAAEHFNAVILTESLNISLDSRTVFMIAYIAVGQILLTFITCCIMIYTYMGERQSSGEKASEDQARGQEEVR